MLKNSSKIESVEGINIKIDYMECMLCGYKPLFIPNNSNIALYATSKFVLEVKLLSIYILILRKGLYILLTAALGRRTWAILSAKGCSLDLHMPIVFHM